MKRVEFSRAFIKNYKRRISSSPKLSAQFDERFALFMRGDTGSPLNDHALRGEQCKYRAFSISGDVRVIYEVAGDIIVFRDIGTHSQVY